MRSQSLVSMLAGWPRRLAAVVCLLIAGLSVVTDHGSVNSGQRVAVVVVTHDLAAGSVLSTSDMTLAAWPIANAPPRALHATNQLTGHLLGAAMTQGEPLTPARLLDAGVTTALLPNQVAATVMLSDPVLATIIHAGALIDVYAGRGDTIADGRPVAAETSAPPIATGVRVLAVLPTGRSGDGTGVTVVLAVDRVTASHLANGPPRPWLATLRPPS